MKRFLANNKSDKVPARKKENNSSKIPIIDPRLEMNKISSSRMNQISKEVSRRRIDGSKQISTVGSSFVGPELRTRKTSRTAVCELKQNKNGEGRISRRRRADRLRSRQWMRSQ